MFRTEDVELLEGLLSRAVESPWYQATSTRMVAWKYFREELKLARVCVLPTVACRLGLAFLYKPEGP